MGNLPGMDVGAAQDMHCADTKRLLRNTLLCKLNIQIKPSNT